MERMSRGEEWADWGGYDDYKRAFEVALQVTDRCLTFFRF